MKFLCVPCDSPMKLQTVGPPERGSLSVVYSCPECGYEMAMLTNAYETQVVQSLGVRIGPGTGEAASSAVRRRLPVHRDDPRGTGTSDATRPRPASRSPSGGLPPRKPAREHSRVRPPHGADRHREIRPGEGALEVDEKILDAARDFFGM